MKRNILAVLIILSLNTLILCAGCKNMISPESLEINKEYSFEAEIVYNGETTKGNFNRTADGKWTGSISEPYALQGIGIEYSSGNFVLSFSDLSMVLNGDNPELNHAIEIMIKSIENAISKEDISITSNQEVVEIQGKLEENPYVFKLKKDKMIPHILELSSIGFKVFFI